MVWEVGIWFEGEMRGRGVYRVQTVSRVRIVMWGRDGLRERLGEEGGKKAKRDKIEQCLRVHIQHFLPIPNAAVPFGSASKQ